MISIQRVQKNQSLDGRIIVLYNLRTIPFLVQAYCGDYAFQNMQKYEYIVIGSHYDCI